MAVVVIWVVIIIAIVNRYKYAKTKTAGCTAKAGTADDGSQNNQTVKTLRRIRS